MYGVGLGVCVPVEGRREGVGVDFCSDSEQDQDLLVLEGLQEL